MGMKLSQSNLPYDNSSFPQLRIWLDATLVFRECCRPISNTPNAPMECRKTKIAAAAMPPRIWDNYSQKSRAF